jgi:nucleoid DNA-binding protein
MSQEELITMISERAGISRQTVQQIIETIGDVWTEEVLGNGELELDNIGTFLLDHRPGRRGLDTETNEIFVIPPCDYVSFMPSRELIEWSNKIQ